MRRILATCLGLSLALAACGGDSIETAEDVETLDVAFAESAEASSYRVSSRVGQRLSMPALGIESDLPVENAPLAVINEIGPEITHTVVDMGAILGAFGANLDIAMEMWQTPDRLVIDTSDFEQLIDLDPGVSLGPLAPGVAFVDLARLGVDGPELVEAIAGTGLTSIDEMTQALSDAVVDVRQVESSPTVYEGTTTFSAYLAATGGDVEATARSIAAGLALNLPVSVDALTQAYVDYYDSLRIDIRIGLDDEGLLRSIRTVADLSGVGTQLFGDNSPLIDEMSAAEIAAARAQFEDIEFVQESVLTFEIDDRLEIEPAPETDDDRTEGWRDFVEASGF